MKKPSVASLSMELYYKSYSAADSTRNIIMLLSFKCTHSSIRQQQIPAVFRILLNKHLSLQEAPSVPFLYKYPKNRDKKFFNLVPSASFRYKRKAKKFTPMILQQVKKGVPKLRRGRIFFVMLLISYIFYTINFQVSR